MCIKISKSKKSKLALYNFPIATLLSEEAEEEYEWLILRRVGNAPNELR